MTNQDLYRIQICLRNYLIELTRKRSECDKATTPALCRSYDYEIAMAVKAHATAGGPDNILDAIYKARRDVTKGVKI